jgi:hypothetical protein
MVYTTKTVKYFTRAADAISIPRSLPCAGGMGGGGNGTHHRSQNHREPTLIDVFPKLL